MSEAGKRYEIRWANDNTVYCTCPAFRFNKSKAQSCKHMEAFRAHLLEEQSAEAKPAPKAKKTARRRPLPTPVPAARPAASMVS